jgi:dolichyl-diphosphooligosaccharide--protein glycosyltransferase
MSAYFALKMIRLVLLCAPAISAAAAMAIVLPLEWSLRQFVQTKLWSLRGTLWKLMALGVVSLLLAANHVKLPLQKKPYVVKYKGFPLDIPTGTGIPYRVHTGFTWKIPQPNWEKVMNLTKTKPKKLLLSKSRASKFLEHCETLAEHLSEPQIILRGSDHSGNTVLIDDFRESYFWLRDNTPEDARIMAWWDYGYQITGIGNRTSIADGNTWNHEHIALLGRCLVSNEEEGHKLIRHLADYMLIWTTRYAGMYGDDLAKSPHMARIAGSVYSDIKPSKFYIDQMGQPSRMMRESVLFKLHYYKLDPTMKVKQLKHFKEVHTTKNRMVRIYKVLNVSKPSKRHPFGSYPPALKSTLDKAKDFSEVKRLQRLKAKKFD